MPGDQGPGVFSMVEGLDGKIYFTLYDGGASLSDGDGQIARVTREVDAGLEVIEVDLPCVITVDLRLNEPRFIKLPDIMKAKSKPMETIAFDTLGVESGDHHKVIKFAAPTRRTKGTMVKDVPALVAALKAKGLL